MSELGKKVDKAIKTLRTFNDDSEPYYLCYSGGKDSDTIRILAEMSGVNYELHNNHTTVDTPTTVHYIKDVVRSYCDVAEFGIGDDGRRFEKHGNAYIHYPTESMWQLIERKHFPPTRIVRYCCKELKEYGGKGRRKVTGVRWSESVNRAKNQGRITIIGRTKTVENIAEESNADFIRTDKGGVVLNIDNDPARRVVESCYRTTSTLINPIIDWTDDDVWEFLHCNGCQSNPEYQCGLKRVGCIGCPMAGGKQQKKGFNKYPIYRENYVKAFDRMLKRIENHFDIDAGHYWSDGESVMRWWVGDDPLQITLDDWISTQDGSFWIGE